MKTQSHRPHAFEPGRRLQLYSDPMHDPYRLNGKLREPAVCETCGAVQRRGQWKWDSKPEGAAQVLCPACRRTQERQPAGYLKVKGAFFAAHRAEIIALIRNFAHHARDEHPLERIMAVEDHADHALVTTTGVHLARGLGEALAAAYQGELDLHFDKAAYLLRAEWTR